MWNKELKGWEWDLGDAGKFYPCAVAEDAIKDGCAIKGTWMYDIYEGGVLVDVVEEPAVLEVTLASERRIRELKRLLRYPNLNTSRILSLLEHSGWKAWKAWGKPEPYGGEEERMKIREWLEEGDLGRYIQNFWRYRRAYMSDLSPDEIQGLLENIMLDFQDLLDDLGVPWRERSPDEE